MNQESVESITYTNDSSADFTIERNGNRYNVAVIDEIETKNHYHVTVVNVDDASDRDYISLTPITKFMQELVQFLFKNLRINTNDEGRIDYISVSNDD